MALAARGFVTVSISYRLSGEAKFPAAIEDVKAAVRWLQANPAPVVPPDNSGTDQTGGGPRQHSFDRSGYHRFGQRQCAVALDDHQRATNLQLRHGPLHGLDQITHPGNQPCIEGGRQRPAMHGNAGLRPACRCLTDLLKDP